MTTLKRTPLYEEHVKLGAKIVDFAGWEMPIEYSGITQEHLAVRHKCGLFDVSHMGEILVTGPDSERFLQYLVPGDVTKLVPNQIMYNMLLNEHGGIIDDLLIYKYNEEKYLLVVNAANTAKDYNWIVNNSKDFNVTVTDKSNEFGQVALQGPLAKEHLQKFTDYDLSTVKYFYFAEFEVCGIPCLVSRTGYTGEDGFEIYTASGQIGKIWKNMLSDQCMPIGLGARDTLRFEAGMVLYGNEISDDITPLEAGLGFFVRFEKDFIGKEALLKQKDEGIKRRLVGLELLRKGICRHGYPVCNQAEVEIGFVTTGYLLPEHEYCVALALIDVSEAVMDNEVKVNIRNKFFEAKVVSKRFMNKSK